MPRTCPVVGVTEGIRVVGYVQASTEEQGAEGAGLEPQRQAIERSALGAAGSSTGSRRTFSPARASTTRPWPEAGLAARQLDWTQQEALYSRRTAGSNRTHPSGTNGWFLAVAPSPIFAVRSCQRGSKLSDSVLALG